MGSNPPALSSGRDASGWDRLRKGVLVMHDWRAWLKCGVLGGIPTKVGSVLVNCPKGFTWRGGNSVGPKLWGTHPGGVIN